MDYVKQYWQACVIGCIFVVGIIAVAITGMLS